MSFQVAVTAKLLLDGRAGELPLIRATPEGSEDIDIEFTNATLGGGLSVTGWDQPLSLTHPLPLPSRRPSVSFGGFRFRTPKADDLPRRTMYAALCAVILCPY